jgi:thiamine biosynthesis protein ThiS
MLARVGPTGFLVEWRRADHTVLMRSSLTLMLNGESRELDAPLTVAGLLTSLGLDARKVAVERNEEIVPRSAYAETWLGEGDWLEIVHFIGGG